MSKLLIVMALFSIPALGSPIPNADPLKVAAVLELSDGFPNRKSCERHFAGKPSAYNGPGCQAWLDAMTAHFDKNGIAVPTSVLTDWSLFDWYQDWTETVRRPCEQELFDEAVRQQAAKKQDNRELRVWYDKNKPSALDVHLGNKSDVRAERRRREQEIVARYPLARMLSPLGDRFDKTPPNCTATYKYLASIGKTFQDSGLKPQSTSKQNLTDFDPDWRPGN